jgi:pyruvyl transferase EpsO
MPPPPDFSVFDPPAPPPLDLQEAFWRDQQQRLESQLGAIVPKGSAVAYLGYQLQGNLGDQLIYLACERWMEAHQLRVIGRWHADNFPFTALPRDTILVCSGGGNFGNLYRFQRFRERVFAAYPTHRIVVLPQSIHFTAAEHLHESARRLAQHPDLHLCLRDEQSLEIARNHFSANSIYLVPDMVSLLHPLRQRIALPAWPPPAEETLYLLRNDKERRRPEWVRSHLEGRGIDWPDLYPGRYALAVATRAGAFVLGRATPAAPFAAAWRGFAHSLAIAGAVRFARARRIVTDRLHAHLLASLLGIPNTLLDNSYGKNSAYFQTWTAALGLTRLVQ